MEKILRAAMPDTGKSGTKKSDVKSLYILVDRGHVKEGVNSWFTIFDARIFISVTKRLTIAYFSDRFRENNIAVKPLFSDLAIGLDSYCSATATLGCIATVMIAAVMLRHACEANSHDQWHCIRECAYTFWDAMPRSLPRTFFDTGFARDMTSGMPVALPPD